GTEGRPDEAVAEFQQAIAIRPNYWRNHQALGLFSYSASRYADAAAELSKVVDLRPDDGGAFQQLGAAYHALGDKTRARSAYERANAINPNAGAYSGLGTLDYGDGRFQDAVDDYQSSIKLRPNNALTHRNLGDTYLKLGRASQARAEYAEARRLIEQSLAVNPNDAGARGRLAVLEAKLGRHDEAERQLNGALALNPASPQLMYYRAVVLALSGKRAQAMAALSDAIGRGYSVSSARE